MASLYGPDWTHGRCTTPEEYLVLQADAIARNAREIPGRYGDVKPHKVDILVTAYVNQGRWLVDCPCGSGVATSPSWNVAACFSCGAIYRNIKFPPEVKDVETALLVRPEANRNWLASESVDDLQAQNAEHGLVVAIAE